MKINIDVNGNQAETQITISCNSLTPEIEQILAAIRILNKQLTGKKDGEIFLINLDDVIYLESIDRKCFIYTKQDVYEAEFKLYEMEFHLSDYGFVRASKSCLIQLKHIKSLKSDIGQKIKITLKNGEQIVVSRQYAVELKNRLGVK